MSIYIMTEVKEDILVQNSLDFVINIITRQEVDQEILLLYEILYRDLKRVANLFELDTTNIEMVREMVMRKYGQI